jgi:hypothetical protein
MKTIRHRGLTLLEVPGDGPLLSMEQDAVDLIGEAYGPDADLIVVPVERLGPQFLELRTGIAGMFFQKMQQYQRRLVVEGDISAAIAASRSLRDFVHETNSLGHHLFVPDRETLLARL